MTQTKRIFMGVFMFLAGIQMGSSAQNDGSERLESWALKGHKKIAKGVPIPRTLPKLWANITVLRSKLSEAIGENNARDAHNLVYAIRDHVWAMSKKSSSLFSKSVLAELRERSNIIAGLAGDLDEAIERGSVKKAENIMGPIDAELKMIKGLYADDALTVEGTYTCPMQAEITSSEFGKCPKCGMDFVVKNN